MPDMIQSAKRLVLAGLLGSCLTACRQEKIETYTVPKESEMPAMEGMLPREPSAPSRLLTWTTPKGWEEKPASDMRLGSFRIPGAHHQEADMSVIPLSGEAGGDLANINRWRGQIHIPPLTESDLTAQSEMITSGGRKMLYVNFVSQAPLIQNQYKKRLIAAIYHRGETTWFFKLMGEDATVLSAKPAFLQFLKSLKFHEH